MATEFQLPSKEEFMALFSLFPKGNPEKAYTEVRYIITNKTLFDGSRITWDIIKDKFTEYIKKKQEVATDPQYIKALESFLKAGDYNIDFGITLSVAKKDDSKGWFSQKMDEALDDYKKKLGN